MGRRIKGGKASSNSSLHELGRKGWRKEGTEASCSKGRGGRGGERGTTVSASPGKGTPGKQWTKSGWGKGHAEKATTLGAKQKMVPPTPQQIQWNRELVASWSSEEILRLSRSNLSGFNLVNCTTALQRLAKTGGVRDGPSELAPLVSRTVELVEAAGEKCPSQNLANAIWACGRMTVENSDAESLVSAARQALLDPRRLRQFTGQHLANVMWGAAKLGGTCAADFSAFGAALANKAWELNGHELSMAAWAMATCGESAGLQELVEAVRGLRGGVKSLNAQQVATLAWALAKLGQGDAALFGDIAEAALDEVSAGTVNGQDLASLAWAFGRREVSSPSLFQAIGSAVQHWLAEDSVSALSPRHLSMVLWGFAKVGSRCTTTARAIVKAAERRITELAPRDLTDLVWAVATMKLRAESFVEAAGRAGEARISEFNSQELLKFLGALRRAGGGKKLQQDLASQERELTYEFPSLGAAPVMLCSGTPGTGGKRTRRAQTDESPLGGDPQRSDGRATGTALWEASYVLAEWLSRQDAELSGACGLVRKLLPHGRVWRGRRPGGARPIGVELGAGLGLPSVVASRLGFDMVATDGDPAVLELLGRNAERNAHACGGQGSLRAQKLLWGTDSRPGNLGLERAPDLLLAADVVYASAREDLTAQLETTLLQLCGPRTLMLVANVRRFPKGHEKGEGLFFERLKPHFQCAELPQHHLHKDFQRTGIGSCAVHILRRRPAASSGDAEMDVTSTTAPRGKKRRRATVPSAADAEAAAAVPRPQKRRKAGSDGASRRKSSAQALAPLVSPVEQEANKPREKRKPRRGRANALAARASGCTA